MEFLSSSLYVEFDSTSKNLLIYQADRVRFPDPLVTIRESTYSKMNLNEVIEFVGSRIVLLIPQLREQFKEELERLASSETGKGFKTAK